MASQSAIAEGGSVVTADQINYDQKMFSHPSYRFEPQFPNTFGQTISLGSSQTPVVINIPPVVFNLSQSLLLYTVLIPHGARFIWYALQALREISHIQFYSGSNMWIVDLDNLQNYLDIVLKKELEQDEFLSLDPMTGISANNSVVNVIPALRNANYNGNNTLTTGFAANPSSVNYTEPSYFRVSDDGVDVTYNVQFPLRLIKNTAFSVDKNFYLGQTSYLKLYFGPLSKICYNSTSNANPSAAAKTSYSGAATISNLQLMLAVETNQDLSTMTINKVSTVGLSYLIPYVQSFKINNQGGAQTVSVQLDQGNGRSLMKVYHAPYNSQEDLDTMYDHSNNDTISGVLASTINQKVQQYYTQLNGKRNQDITIDCTSTAANPFLDYMSHRRQLRGSVLSNLNVYQYNWFHCDDWTDFGPRYDQDNKGELISGIPMSVAPLTWSFVGVRMRPNVAASDNDRFQHYTWFVFVKKLTMSLGIVTVQ